MKKTLSVALLFLFGPILFAQERYSKEILEQIKAVENHLAGDKKIIGEPDASLEERMKHYKLKGVSIAVVHNYKIVWAKGYGWADEQAKRPVTTATLFEPGSISKSLNAVGVLKLVQDGKLDLYTDINKYLASWKFPYDSVSKGKIITLAQLLSHSAGLTVHGFPGYDRMAKIPTLPQVLNGEPPANTRAVRSMFAPGLRSQYSGGGTTISQLIISDITKQPYDVFMYEQVLKPIGMANSFYTQPPPQSKLHLCATGYHADGSPVQNQFHVYPEQAAAGLWMTPTDLCNYIIETQLAYEGRSSKVLNQEMTRLRLTPYNDEYAALGVFVAKKDGATYFEHGAGNEGFCGQYFGSLDGNGMAVFINSDNGAILTEIANSVATVYKWKDFYNPVYKTAVQVAEKVLQQYTGVYLYEDKWASILKRDGEYYLYADRIYSKMYFSNDSNFFNKEFASEKQFVRGDAGAITGYKRTANDKELPAATRIANPDTLQLNKETLNEIAWHLLEVKKPAEAVPYLNRALQQDPTYLLGLGNLAHAYLFTGNYKKAMEIYGAHMKETIFPSMTWQDMIQQDFVFFKRNGYETAEMDKVFAELGISKPNGY